MSYWFSFSGTPKAICQLFPELSAAPQAADFQPAYAINGYSFAPHPVILSEQGQLKLKMFEWGMIKENILPSTDSKQLNKLRAHLLKARAEKIVGDPNSLWYRKRQNRVLIPATGFFEHREVRGFKGKVLYYIYLKDRPVFFLPGLYNYTRIPDVNESFCGTFTMISRDGNAVMKSIHNSGPFPYRMPLMLPASMERQWLDPTLSDQDLQSILEYEMPSAELGYYPVKSLYRPDPRDPSIIAPVDYPGLPPVENKD